jgi:hypothetical protein
VKFLGALENGYLQLVRIFFLILATLALVVAVVKGVPALKNYNAEAEAVPSNVSVSATNFQLEGDAKSADGHSTDSAPANPKEKEKAALVDALHAVLISKGKALSGADFTYDKSNLIELVGDWYNAADHGAKYVSAQTRYLDEVLSRDDVSKTIKADPSRFFETVNAAILQFGTDWQSQQDAIKSKKEAAELDASLKRIEALRSIGFVGGALGLFITLVLSLIMFRVDRSIRQIALTREKA